MKQHLKTSTYSNILIGIAFAVLLSTAIPVYSQTPDNAFDEIPLNGLASFVQLRKEYYIGGLYLETLNQDAGSFNFTGKKRMELRISIDKWSPRRFAQQWSQSILINNEQALLEEFADQILEFTNIAKENLIAGDRIVINMNPSQGTNVYLNNHLMMSVSNNAFFDVLLSTWVGQRPPSSDFRDNILTLPTGRDSTELLTRYDAISPEKSREQQVAAWVKPQKSSNKPKPAATTAVASSASNSMRPPANFDTTSTAKRDTPTLDSSETRQPEFTAMQPELAAPKTTVEFDQPTLATSKPKQSTPAAKQVAAATTKPAATKPPAAKKNVDNPATPPPLAADDEQEKLLKIYRSNVIKLTYLNTRYPKRAMDFKQEGLVVLKVKISRQGKVLDIIQDSVSKYKLLNKAAVSAIKKTSPYPEVPKNLLGEYLEINLPFNFQL